MCIKTFHLSAQGASHIKRGKECQDASASCCKGSYAIAIVCDGHGGDDYVRSAIGADFARKAAQSCIEVFLHEIDSSVFTQQDKEREKQIVRLEGSIISAWNASVRSHYESHPFTEAEIACLSSKAQKKYLQASEIESAYGTTLIAAVLTPDYWFGIQIGDGKCAVVDQNGTFTQPIPWNEKCFLNATTSICDSNAIENFRHFYEGKPPVALFVGTDGIDDSFNGDQKMYDFYKTVLYSFATSDFDAAVTELKDYLPRLSANGSGDDVSISGILDLDRICNLDTLKEFIRDREAAQAEGPAKNVSEPGPAAEAAIEEVGINEQ